MLSTCPLPPVSVTMAAKENGFDRINRIDRIGTERDEAG
jgi:hypothetical protein